MAEDLKVFCQKLQDEFVKRYGAGDFKGLSELYTPECKLMSGGTDVMVGREAAAENLFREYYNAGAVGTSSCTDEAGQVHGDECLYQRGHFKVYNAEGSVHDEGKYVVIWKKIDGKYLIDIDIWNSNR
ncbi:uncharacterized protein [Ptychodera flava]|uniref:uncharacterized protein isoform X2 n=1 Tax=Ptychodera flava TaxID=63121 RepID=UPI003969FD77